MLGCRLADYYGQAERIAFAYATAPRRVPIPARILARRIHSIRRSADAARQCVPALRNRRHFVLEQPPAHRALSHRRSRAAAGELGRARTRRAVAGPAHVSPACSADSRSSWCVRRRCALPASAACRATSTTCSASRSCRRISKMRASWCCPRDGLFHSGCGGAARQRARQDSAGKCTLSVEIATRLERTPRGKTPLIVHRPPVHDALRRQGVEPAVHAVMHAATRMVSAASAK